MYVEKEAESGGEVVYVQASGKARLDVLETVCQGKGEFLDSVGASLSNMVATDAYGVPPGDVLGGELHRIHHQPHGRSRRENVLVLGNVLF